MHQGFWKTLPRPIIGLSPMDGVTNAPFRQLVAEYGPADVSVTEFVPVEGLMHKAVRLLRDFVYCEQERPVVAQIYGSDPKGYYAVAHLLCALGFDGIDINMGCPAKKVEQRGCGAGLIRTPDVAKQLVRETQRGVRDWTNGQTPIEAGLPPKVWNYAQQAFAPEIAAANAERRAIPVTVKTRIGYAENTVCEWVQHLLEVEPVVITLHGRTLKQMYKGSADWDAIAAAAEIIHQTDTLVLGNGDLLTAQDVQDRIAHSNVDGVLIGRGCMGNPWLFRCAAALHGQRDMAAVSASTSFSPQDARHAFVRHAELQEAFIEGKGFTQLRRFVKPYTLGLSDAVELRNQLYHVENTDQLRACLDKYWQAHEGIVCS